MGADGSVRLWWIVVFLLLALGAGIGAVLAVGGSIFVVPLGLL